MTSGRYVSTGAIREAVKGREKEVLEALRIAWADGAPHISCPYPDHSDEDPSWRWDECKAKAFCTCIERPHSIFDVVMRIEGLEFEAAKLRVAEILGRQDLVKVRDGERHQAMDAASLLRPPADQRDEGLVRSYLACRLDVPPDQVPVPSTPVVGWRSLAYYDPPAKRSTQPKLVGRPPCVVFGTLSPDGRRHAHRIYTQPDGAGKVELGHRPDGRPRDPKKSATLKEGQSAAGCVVLWGHPANAPHLILCEGVETAAAVALTHRAELDSDEVAVAAALSAAGVRSFQPWPATRRITIAADRDEDRPAHDRGLKAGERAARAFALTHHERLEIRLALPGQHGEDVDWLDVLRRDGVETVRAGLDGAERFVPTAQEIEAAKRCADRASKLAEIERTYALPAMESLTLRYLYTRSGRIMVHRYAGKDNEGNEIWQPVTSPVGVPFRLCFIDQAEAYGLRVVVQGMDGKPRPIDFERGALARMGASELRSKLFAAGLRAEDDGEHVVVKALKAADPASEITVVSRPGWHLLPGLDDPVFVAPTGEIIGAPQGYALELAAHVRLDSRATSGTLEGWQEAIEAAVETANCPHFVLGIIAGFVGPIQGLTGFDSCGLNQSGLSSSGKTLSQRLAVSAWSPTSLGAGLLQSLRTTENAIESIAQSAGGTILALDEMAHVDGRTLGVMIYLIAGGQGKARLSPEAVLRQRYSWTTFILLSGECSLEDVVQGGRQ